MSYQTNQKRFNKAGNSSTRKTSNKNIIQKKNKIYHRTQK